MNEYYKKFVIIITIFNIVYCEDSDGLIESIYDTWKASLRLDIFELEKQEYETIDCPQLLESNESSADEIYISFKTSEEKIELNLKKTDYFIVGPNTPFYLLSNKTNSSALCNKHKISRDVKSFGGFYEDKNNSAFFYVSVGANGTKQVEVGVMKHLTIQRISDYLILPDGEIHTSKKANQYIVQKNDDIPNNYPILTDAEMNDDNSSLSKIPKVIYPKVLLVVDSDFLHKSRAFEGSLTTTIKYLIHFWCRVHMMFRNLVKPEYRISIAGIVIDQDDTIFNSFKTVNPDDTDLKLMDYELAYNGMQKWFLLSPLNCISRDSYSIAMIHTPCFSKKVLGTGSGDSFYSWKIVKEAAFCHVKTILNIPSLTRMENVAMVFDDRFLNNVRLAATEIATALGIFQVNNSDSKTKLMQTLKPSSRPYQNQWSHFSLEGFKAFLKTYPTCIFDAPS